MNPDVSLTVKNKYQFTENSVVLLAENVVICILMLWQSIFYILSDSSAKH